MNNLTLINKLNKIIASPEVIAKESLKELIFQLENEEKNKDFSSSRKQGIKKIASFCNNEKRRPVLRTALYKDGYYYQTDSYFLAVTKDTNMKLYDPALDGTFPQVERIIPSERNCNFSIIEEEMNVSEIKMNCRKKSEEDVPWTRTTLYFKNENTEEVQKVQVNPTYFMCALNTLEYEKNKKDIVIVKQDGAMKQILVKNIKTKELFIICPLRYYD